MPRQRYFYQDEVRPVKEKVAVLISDAFRLEAAKELAVRFRDDENCSVEEKVRMAPLPSITLLGMAELLPHDTLELTRDDTPKILLDGKPCASTAQREKLLQQGNPRSAAILYDELIAMKVSELKSFSAGKKSSTSTITESMRQAKPRKRRTPSFRRQIRRLTNSSDWSNACPRAAISIAS